MRPALLVIEVDCVSIQALEKDIRDWIKTWNGNPRPFTWTKTADAILERLAVAKSESGDRMATRAVAAGIVWRCVQRWPGRAGAVGLRESRVLVTADEGAVVATRVYTDAGRTLHLPLGHKMTRALRRAVVFSKIVRPPDLVARWR